MFVNVLIDIWLRLFIFVATILSFYNNATYVNYQIVIPIHFATNEVSLVMM
jgi:hypothetical protein